MTSVEASTAAGISAVYDLPDSNDRMEALADEIGGYIAGLSCAWHEDCDRGARFLLVEQHPLEGGYWLSDHDTVGDAARYFDTQDDGGWFIVTLIDRETGDHYTGETVTTFTITERETV